MRAIAASPGIAIGKAVLFLPTAVEPLGESARPPDEWERYRKAVELLQQEWMQAKAVAAMEAPSVVPIIDSYLHLLTDAVLQEQVRALIRAGGTAERALQQVMEPVIGRLSRSTDVLLQERGSELEQFLHRLLLALQQHRADYTRVAGAVVVAPAVTPSEVVLLHRAGARGLVTAVGGITSHTTILARSLQLPAVIGLRGAIATIRERDPLIVDGYTGTVVVRPAPETCRRYERHRDSTQWRRRILARFAKLPAQTADGRCFRLMANIASLQDVDDALTIGAEGAGLVRTEILLLHLGRFPTEEEQVQWYREVAERLYPYPVTFRLFDVGGEKYADSIPLERNPALGLRGVRFLFAYPEILRAQLRAILRVATSNVRVLVPMVSTVEELGRVRQLMEHACRELGGEQQGCRCSVPIGAMIETPAAALIADRLARISDFFSIGTNDLTQYTVAVDRTHGHLAQLFDPFHPAVLYLIYCAVEAAHRHGIPVGICGELAAHAEATELLVGLGVDELSTVPAAIVPLKHRIRRISFEQARRRLLTFIGETVERATR
ncbi:MAG: phosphoenolpyruvate--protein phosphotransferase [Bacteroidota bacterium]|nr:phosphoenolpyruvate--protein phosphotransferase [Bacteroidota bacterium]